MTPSASPLPAPAPPVLLRESADGIVTLILNRPDSRNSLSEALLNALADALSEIAADRSVRVVVLAASAPAFSAGHDLKELTAHRSDADRGRAYYSLIMTLCSGMMQQIVRLPQPVIAVVEGIATAAGCQLVASCDLAIASSTARFATPGVNIGLFCSTPMVALSRNVPRKQAMEMLLTGDMLSADDALRIGLVNRVVAPGTARANSLELAHKIAAKSMHVVNIGKKSVLSSARSGSRKRLRVRSRGDGGKHDGARCRGRDRGLRREAHSELGGSLKRPSLSAARPEVRWTRTANRLPFPIIQAAIRGLKRSTL